MLSMILSSNNILNRLEHCPIYLIHMLQRTIPINKKLEERTGLVLCPVISISMALRQSKDIALLSFLYIHEKGGTARF
jgi:hypothetical protein